MKYYKILKNILILLLLVTGIAKLCYDIYVEIKTSSLIYQLNDPVVLLD
jgi:hypothetical protein